MASYNRPVIILSLYVPHVHTQKVYMCHTSILLGLAMPIKACMAKENESDKG